MALKKEDLTELVVYKNNFGYCWSQYPIIGPRIGVSNPQPAGRMWLPKSFGAAREGIFNQMLHRLELLQCIYTSTACVA